MKFLVEGDVRLRIFVSDDLDLEIIFLLSIAFKATNLIMIVLSWPVLVFF